MWAFRPTVLVRELGTIRAKSLDHVTPMYGVFSDAATTTKLEDEDEDDGI